jgi:uncharacterized protein with GYD domain
MHFVLLAEHTAEVCPTSNATTRKIMQELGPQIPSIAESAGVKIVAGPYVNREHITVVVLEADKADEVDRFLIDSRLHQWNRIRVLPSVPIADAMAELDAQPAMF